MRGVAAGLLGVFYRESYLQKAILGWSWLDLVAHLGHLGVILGGLGGSSWPSWGDLGWAWWLLLAILG